MKSSACSAVAVLLTLLCLATPFFAQVPAKLFAQVPAKQPAAKTPHGSVSGRVTIKDKPAPGIVVGLRRTENNNPFEPYSKTTTDQDGAYRITNVAAGSYQVLPAAPGYIASDASNARQAVVVVGEDENIDDVNFTLVRGGVITGRITDADGKPLIQMMVTVYRADSDKQSPPRPPFPETTGQTDDRGIYRIFGLMPGKFKVAAGRREDGFSLNALVGNYKQVFHPDATDVAKATTIELSEGGEATNIDITLGRAQQTFSISGRVINTETNSPVPDMMFGLQRVIGDRMEYVPTTISSNLRGDFVVEGLIPGKYTVMQFGNSGSELRVETTTFDVIDEDLTDQTIRLAPGASISGFVVVDSDDKTIRSKVPEMMLRGFVQSTPGVPTSNAASTVAADGSFRLSGLASGIVNISIMGMSSGYPPKGFSIARIERNGVVTPRLELRDGENVTGVTVVLSYGNGSIRGVITLENGTLPPGARFFVRVTKSGDNNMSLRPPAVDARGRFVMEGVPTGTYEITVSITGGNVKLPPPVKRTVTLADSVATDVAFTIDMGGQSPTNP